MKVNSILAVLPFCFVVGCQSPIEKTITVQNNSEALIVDELVTIELNDFGVKDPGKLSVFYLNEELPSQVIDSDLDGKVDQISFLIDLESKETKNVNLKLVDSPKEFPQRTHAEVSEKRDYKIVDGVYTGGRFESVKTTTTPPGHRDHNFFYKCEGPAWESDKVGYRLYLDARNSTDIFGKKINDIVLPQVGHTKDSKGSDTYHTMADWGMDLLKVGNSLGIGSFGAWIDNKVEKVSDTDSIKCTITNDGPISASLNIKYHGWEFGKGKSDLNTTLSISAGRRLTHYSMELISEHLEYCTGLAKHANTQYIKSENKGDNEWNFIALWGNQSLADTNDELGTVLFYNNKQLVKLIEDEYSHIVILNPNKGEIDYYFAACWVQEPGGIKSLDEFKKYLANVLVKLNNPVTVAR